MLLESVRRPGEVPGHWDQRAGEAGQVEHGLAEHRQHEAGQDQAAEQLRPRHRDQGPEGARGSPGGGNREVQVHGGRSQNGTKTNNANITTDHHKNNHNSDGKEHNIHHIRE